jgi:hydroxymethylpyrimidine pyrophosphatase-like HAD family hydrolase
MRLRVVALDYDGTIAEGGTVHPDVRAAIVEARARGVLVVLVTGRIVRELLREVPDLRLFDAVVGENGGVVSFPDTGRARVLGDAPPARFLEALRGRGIEHLAGECVVEAEADRAHAILAVIRELELPLVLVFNRGRVMVLPQAVSKATGLDAALTALRLSAHNTVAFGDAENDHALLLAAEVGIAVGWGSDALKRAADMILEGAGPAAVAPFMRRIVDERRIVRPARCRRCPTLGWSPDGHAVTLPERGQNLLVTGDPKSGKSWVAGLLAEQLVLQRYCLCLLDPEGDYRSLEALPGVVVMGGSDPPPRPHDVVRAMRYPDVSLVIDLSRLAAFDKREYVRSLLGMLTSLRRETGLPHRVVVDEAHYFLHEPADRQQLDLDLGGFTFITFRTSRLHREVLDTAETVVVTGETDPHEVRALARWSGSTAPREWEALFASLALEEAILLERGPDARPERFRIAPRLTPHVRHRNKYLDVPLPEGRAFVFTRDGKPVDPGARTLRELAQRITALPRDVVEAHLRRGDVSRWIHDVFADRELAERIADLEHLCRTGEALDAADGVAELIESRYWSASGV